MVDFPSFDKGDDAGDAHGGDAHGGDAPSTETDDGQRGPGRPPKPDAEKRTEFVSFRATRAEKKRIEERAERAGKDLSSFSRSAALGTPMQTAEARAASAKTIREISRVGNNLNQIARHLNSGEGYDPAQLTGVIEELRAALRRV